MREVSRPSLRHLTLRPPTQYSPTYDPRRPLSRSGQLVLWCRDALSGVLLVLRAPAGARPTALLRPRYVSVSKKARLAASWRLKRGLYRHFESAALPDSRPLTFAAPYAVFSNVRPSASIPFDPAALPEAVVVDGRAAAYVCGLRDGGGRDRIVAGARGVGPGTYDAPGLSRRRHGDGSKAVMSLCCGSISSSFRAPAGVRPTVLRASTAPGKPHPRRAASGRTRRPPAAPAARRLRERIPPARPRTSHPLLRLTRRSRRRRADRLLPSTHRLAPKT